MSVNYRTLLKKSLKNKREAIGYLNMLLENCIEDNTEDIFFVGLSNVIEAWESKECKKQLEKIMTSDNPKWYDVIKLINKMGLQLSLKNQISMKKNS